MTLLAAERMSAGYGGRPVVTDISLSVEPGEIIGILGANGAGKSTTLRAFVGEIPVLAGTVDCLGETGRSPLHRRARMGLGYIPEDRAVFSALTVRDNLRLGRGSVDDAVGFFPELEKHLGRKAGLLSGGQQQMVTLGRALAANPEILVVDELSQGLAPIVVGRLFAALTDAARRGVGILLVEQHARLALGVASRVLVMRRGKIVFRATAEVVNNDISVLHELYLGVDRTS